MCSCARPRTPSWQERLQRALAHCQDVAADVLRDDASAQARAQGVLCFAGTARKVVFQGVHMLCTMAELEATWPPGEATCSTLVFIGRGLDRAELEAAVKACAADAAE